MRCKYSMSSARSRGASPSSALTAAASSWRSTRPRGNGAALRRPEPGWIKRRRIGDPPPPLEVSFMLASLAWVSCSRPGCLVSRPAASQHWRSGIPYAIWRVTVERATLVHSGTKVAGPREHWGARTGWRGLVALGLCDNTALSSCHYKCARLTDRVDGLLGERGRIG